MTGKSIISMARHALTAVLLGLGVMAGVVCASDVVPETNSVHSSSTLR